MVKLFFRGFLDCTRRAAGTSRVACEPRRRVKQKYTLGSTGLLKSSLHTFDGVCVGHLFLCVDIGLGTMSLEPCLHRAVLRLCSWILSPARHSVYSSHIHILYNSITAIKFKYSLPVSTPLISQNK